jgi:hypothetical protein
VGNPPLLLQVAMENGAVELSWPLTPEDYLLETSVGLGADAQWTPALPGSAPIVGTEHRVTLSPSDVMQFFRLRQQ